MSLLLVVCLLLFYFLLHLEGRGSLTFWLILSLSFVIEDLLYFFDQLAQHQELAMTIIIHGRMGLGTIVVPSTIPK